MNTGLTYGDFWEKIYEDVPCFLFAFAQNGIITRMNREMRERLKLDPDSVIGRPVEEILTVGSKIFWQTHFYPLIKMQQSAREIYLSFKSPQGSIPVLLNVRVRESDGQTESICGGMEISNRDRFEKELLEAKKIAEDALNENAELIRIKNDLLENKRMQEIQFLNLRSLQEQQQELFKLIAHDLQEPLRKSIFFSDHLLDQQFDLPATVVKKLQKIIRFNEQLREMLLTLQKFEQLNHVRLNCADVSLERTFAEACAEIDSDEVKLEISQSFGNSVFRADGKMLKNLFVELLRSSVKTRNPENEILKIEISAIDTQKNIFTQSHNRYQYDNFIKISYSDNGSGFNTDSSKIFKIIQKSVHFNQISIGLAYCKRIVELHSGFMVAKTVRSKGAGFTIWIPLNKAD